MLGLVAYCPLKVVFLQFPRPFRSWHGWHGIEALTGNFWKSCMQYKVLRQRKAQRKEACTAGSKEGGSKATGGICLARSTWGSICICRNCLAGLPRKHRMDIYIYREREKETYIYIYIYTWNLRVEPKQYLGANLGRPSSMGKQNNLGRFFRHPCLQAIDS